MSSLSGGGFLNRNNEVLDYIDCLSNDGLPFDVSTLTLNDSETETQNTEIDHSPSFEAGKELHNKIIENCEGT